VGEDAPPAGQLPFTPNAAAAYHRVLDEAAPSGETAIGTEDVLRAILRRGASLAARILEELGVQPGTIADRLRRPQPDAWPITARPDA
jgi:hypothetical protein